ncbi:MAG: ABC transporter substrate-binding protein [Burkholderiales bacterium]|jgi:arginine/ornithine transport system substrate-binding protein|nr:ABC transporter substrate-binding protein [Betaproteobacteria bacterium]
MNVFLRCAMVAALVAVLGSFSAAALAQAKKVRLGVEGAYPPFSEIDTSGKLKGFDIDMANALCSQMKVECVMVQLSFDGMIPALNSRKIDAVIASMSITDERKKAVDFSDKYYKTPARFVVKTGVKLDITPAGLKGKRIGVQRSTVFDRFLGENFKGADVVRYTKQDEVFLDLASGRIDAALQDSVAAQEGFLKTAQGKSFTFIGPSYEDPKYFGYGAGIAVRKGDNALREDFNRAIAAIRANGGYKKIQDAYFDFDVYGAPAATAAGAATNAATKK